MLNIGAYVISALLLGSNWYATRVALQGYKPITAAALRFGIASVIFLAIWAAGWAGARPNRKELKWLGLSGLLNAIQYGLIFFALLWVSGGLAAVIFGTVQLFTALIAHVTKVERVTLASLVGAPISIAGLAVIYWDRLGLSSAQATGVTLMLAAVIISAIGTVILKHHGRRVSPVVTTTIFLTMSGIVLGIGAIVHERHAFAWPASITPTIAVVYQGVLGSAAAFGVYFFMLKRVSAVTASSIGFVLPVVALAIDWVAQEPLRLTGKAYIGVLLTLAGLIVGFFFTRRRIKAAAAAAAAAKKQ